MITVIYAIFSCLSAFNVRRLVVTNSIGQIGIVLVAISCGTLMAKVGQSESPVKSGGISIFEKTALKG